MVKIRSSEIFTGLLAGSVVLTISGVFFVNYGLQAAVTCISYTLRGQVIDILGLGYRLKSIGLEQVVYYDGCRNVSVTTASLLPVVIGRLSFIGLVSYPAIRSFPAAKNRVNTVLVVLGTLGILLGYYLGDFPGYVVLILLGFVASMRSQW